MNTYCTTTCNIIFKRLASCPNPKQYPSGDFSDVFVNYLWVFASVLPYIINIGFVFYLVFARSSRVLFLFGALAIQNTLNEHVIKKILAESRPIGACSESYGLPSGHSSFAAGLATWLILELIVLHERVPFKKDKIYKMMAMLYIMISPLIPISRHYLNYHSIKQIWCGVFAGIFFSMLTFYLMMTLMYKNEGKYWSGLMRRINQKLKFEENILMFKSESRELLLNEIESDCGENPDQQEEGLIEQKVDIILPLRDHFRSMFFKTLQRTISDKSINLQTL